MTTKTKRSAKRLVKPVPKKDMMTNQMKAELALIKMQNHQMVMNLMTSRLDWMRKEVEGQKDVDVECGYPTHKLEARDFKKLARRFGIAKRVVTVMSEECWAVDPNIYEDDDPEVETEFEKKFNELDEEFNLLHYMEQADADCGIGRFGVILLGLSDGKKLNTPAVQTDLMGKPTEKVSLELLYLRVFDETRVKIVEVEKNPKSKRYGQPVMYDISFPDMKGDLTTRVDRRVHWTRIVHISDGDVTANPRMENVYNTLLDLKKIYGGSAEMFWKGAFPGFAFEIDPDAEEELEIDSESIKEEFWRYSEGLQRSLQIAGVTVKQLAPQVADPTGHIKALLNFLTMTIGCPLRIFMGSEMAHLASDQDQGTWNQRVARRQKKHVIPRIIRKTINHFIMLGILPDVKYKVSFPDIHTPSQLDKATIAKTIVEAMAKYVATGAERLMPPELFFTTILGFSIEEVKVIMEKAKAYAVELKKRQEEEMRMQKELMGPAAMGSKTGQGGPRVRGAANPNGGVKKTNTGKPIGKAAA